MTRQASTVPADFEQLVRTHGARIRRIARRYAAKGAVDDLVQDILTRLWRSYPGFRGDARVESWIYRVALNASMTHVSATIRERELQETLSALSATDYVSAASASAEDILSSFLARIGEVDDTGKVTGLILHQLGRDLPGKRLQ